MISAHRNLIYRRSLIGWTWEVVEFGVEDRPTPHYAGGERRLARGWTLREKTLHRKGDPYLQGRLPG